MIDDIFCKIIAKEIPAETVYEDDDVLVIKDIHPQAPIHLLVMPKQHWESLADADDAEVLGKLLKTAHRIAQEQALDKGYRLILNEGEHGGKLVPHLHIHLLGGRALGAKIVHNSDDT